MAHVAVVVVAAVPVLAHVAVVVVVAAVSVLAHVAVVAVAAVFVLAHVAVVVAAAVAAVVVAAAVSVLAYVAVVVAAAVTAVIVAAAVSVFAHVVAAFAPYLSPDLPHLPLAVGRPPLRRRLPPGPLRPLHRGGEGAGHQGIHEKDQGKTRTDSAQRPAGETIKSQTTRSVDQVQFYTSATEFNSTRWVPRK